MCGRKESLLNEQGLLSEFIFLHEIEYFKMLKALNILQHPSSMMTFCLFGMCFCEECYSVWN
jgi:hypothetical protein